MAETRSLNLSLRNRQRRRRVDRKLLRRIVSDLLKGLDIHDGELSIQLVNEKEITRLNETFLRHKGATDVITFSYLPAPQPNRIMGDVVVCVDEAVSQAGRFGSTWQSELIRYIVHGVLHLLGHDDKLKRTRLKMRRTENALVRTLALRHRFSAIGRSSKLRARDDPTDYRAGARAR